MARWCAVVCLVLITCCGGAPGSCVAAGACWLSVRAWFLADRFKRDLRGFLYVMPP